MKRKMKKNNIVSNVLRIIGLVFIACSIFLVIFNIVRDFSAGKKSREALDQLAPIIEKNKSKDSSFDGDMPTVEVDGKLYVGIITMDSVGIKLPVLYKYSQSNLNIAPTLYKGSIYQDNAIIIAHNSISHFKKIENLNVGDIVVFEDVNGNKFSYSVLSSERIFERDVAVMEQGNWDLTLFTCASNIRFRSTIRLERIRDKSS